MQLWHDQLQLPVLDVTDGAWALAEPEFAADGSQLRFDVVALASKARFPVTVDLAVGHWRSPGEPRGLPVAVLQQRYGSSSAISAWPVVPPAPVEPPRELEGEVAPPDDAPVRPPDDAPVRPAEDVVVTAPPPAATPAAEPPPEDVLPPPAATADGRWRFQFAWAPVHERDASGRLRAYCHFVLHDTHAAVGFDSRTTGDLCWPAGRWLRLVRGAAAPVWFLVDLERAVFWLENFREPLGPERPLDELVATLSRR